MKPWILALTVCALCGGGHAQPEKLRSDAPAVKGCQTAVAGEGEQAQSLAQVLNALRCAASQGDVRAQYELAQLLSEGNVTDDAEAVTWFRQAAEQGHAGAQHGLGIMLAHGRGVEKDEAQAEQWLQRAAQQGDREAQLDLGMMLIKGLGVPENPAQGAHWVRRAAVQGQADAQLLWALMLLNGESKAQENDNEKEKNEAEAYFWLLVTDSPRDAAQRFRGDLKKRLSPEAIRQAQAQARTWKPTPEALP